MNYKQQLECKNWQFNSISEFTGGKMNPLFADCGNGLNDIPDSASFMHFFTDVKPGEIRDYVLKLENSGLKKAYEKEICGNLFYQFETAEGLLYISYFKNHAAARIILDRCLQKPVCGFGYSRYEQLRDNTVCCQYSLHYDDMINGITCDCGMNYIFRLRDNSLIIIDGGEIEQSTEIAAEDYMKFLRELTQTENEKMRISLWICTHAHNDHCDFLSKIIRKYPDEISIERVAFNFPNPENVSHSDSVATVRQRISGAFPEAEYIKLHAGTEFSIANAKIEVFVSAEDAVAIEDNDPFPGTNSTSVLFRITADGIKTLFLADCTDDNGSVLIDNYDESVTCCDILQAAHHGINRIYDVYEKVNTDFVFLPQCRMNMENRFPEIFEHLIKRYGEDNIFLAHDKTVIFTASDGKYDISTREHIGTAFDNSEF